MNGQHKDKYKPKCTSIFFLIKEKENEEIIIKQTSHYINLSKRTKLSNLKVDFGDLLSIKF